MVRYPLLVVVALIGAGPVVADDDVDDDAQQILESARTWVPARPIERKPPRYPGAELSAGREAWVEVEYCIDEAGTPQNVTILDSGGSKSFERAALVSVRKWQFEPALVDGEPSWQSGNRSIIRFHIEGNKGGSRWVRRKFKELGELIDADRLAEADELFTELIDNDKLNLYEIAKIWSQRVRYEAKLGDFRKLDLALHRATASHGEWIDEESYLTLLNIRIRVEIQLGHYVAALSAFEELADKAGEEDSRVIALRPNIEQLEAIIAGDAVLETSAEIRAEEGCYGCFDSYRFQPARRHFAFADVTGELRSIEMSCQRKRFESAVSEDVEWHIPKSWGNCSVQVFGKPGTTFKVLTLPEPSS